MSLNNNNTVERVLTVEKVTFGGRGLVRTEEFGVVFIPDTLPGDIVRVALTAQKKNTPRPNFLRS